MNVVFSCRILPNQERSRTAYSKTLGRQEDSSVKREGLEGVDDTTEWFGNCIGYSSHLFALHISRPRDCYCHQPQIPARMAQPSQDIHVCPFSKDTLLPRQSHPHVTLQPKDTALRLDGVPRIDKRKIISPHQLFNPVSLATRNSG